MTKHAPRRLLLAAAAITLGWIGLRAVDEENRLLWRR